MGCEKTQTAEYSMFPSDKQQSSSIASTSIPSYLKRKRSPSLTLSVDTKEVKSSSLDVQDHKPHVTDGSLPPTNTAPTLSCTSLPPHEKDLTPVKMEVESDVPSRDTVTATIPKAEARRQALKDTISSQLSLEILLKHKELRLIDQELAKCQVALEQLRRCSEIPYPVMQYASEQVSTGRGAAVKRVNERYPAQSPAPWGVTDGPYTRHYAKWLISDPRFDGGEPEPVTPQTAVSVSSYGRSMRTSFTDFAALVGKTSRTQRGSNHMALPAGYGEPKQKPTGPMILKRKSDGKMVKLVCPDCGRHDFGSAQGFINHCRIGHQRNFASHEAAAEACGEPVEYDQQGTIKGIEPVEQTPSGVNVHPLVRSAKLSEFKSTASLRASEVSSPKSKQAPVISGSSDFQGCTQTPHLSALIQGKGMGLDLQNLVSDAKTKVDMSVPEDEESEMEVETQVTANTGRHPQVAGSKQPAKSQGPARTVNGHTQSRLSTSTTASDGDVAITDFAHDLLPTLLPSPTNESNQAPSLVDDDEELDPQSPLSSDEADEHDVHFQVRDDEQPEDGSDLRGAELQSPPGTCAPTPAPRPRAHTRNLSAARDLNANFTYSNVNEGQLDGRDRKRRKIQE